MGEQEIESGRVEEKEGSVVTASKVSIKEVNKKMKLIYIHKEDLQKLYAMSTWKKFKNWSYADIIKWIFENDIITDEIIKYLIKKGE